MFVFVLCVLMLFTAGCVEAGPAGTQPSCSGMAEILACPLNLAPVCGSDGNTYANECSLCVQRLETRTDISIVKMGSC